MVRERGIPERINRNSLGAMVGPGPLGDAIVLLLCCVVSAASPAALAWWDRISRAWGEKRAGVDSRAAISKAFPHQTATRVPAPPGQARSGPKLTKTLLLHEIASISSDFDKILAFNICTTRRICIQSLC